MSARTPPMTPERAFLKVVIAGVVISVAIGSPSLQIAETIGRGGLVLKTLAYAACLAGCGALLWMVLIDEIMRHIWIAWVGLLSGVMPASRAAPRRQLVAMALGYLLGGGLLLVFGFALLSMGIGLASAAWSLFSLCLILAGLGLGFGGAVPWLWWARRGCRVGQPDDTVSRHLPLFTLLALAGLGFSSALAETLPGLLHPDAIPLRGGDWEGGCVSGLEGPRTRCPQSQRYVVNTRAAGRLRLEWSHRRRNTERNCEVAVQDGGSHRRASAPTTYLHLDAFPGRPILVTMKGLRDDACLYDLRVRPDPEPAS